MSYFCGGAIFIFITCLPKLSLLSEIELFKLAFFFGRQMESDG